MKKFLLFVIILLTVNQLAQAQTESIDRFVRKYKRSATGEKVDITVPGWLIRFGMQFMDKDDLEGVDIQAIARKVSEVRVVSIEGGGKVAFSDFQKLIEDAKAENFEELMTVCVIETNVNLTLFFTKNIEKTKGKRLNQCLLPPSV